MLSALPQVAWGHALIWAMMLCVLGGLVVYFYRHHRQWRAHLHITDETTQHYFYTLARTRGWMICYLWGLLSLLIIYQDLRQTAIENTDTRPHAMIAPAQENLFAAPAPNPLTAARRNIEIDKIKTYFEDAFVSYYYLHKCGVAREEDNAILYRALWKALEVYQATDNAAQIMSAAKGSFEVIYSGVSCEENKLVSVQSRFDLFISSLAAPRAATSPAP